MNKLYVHPLIILFLIGLFVGAEKPAEPAAPGAIRQLSCTMQIRKLRKGRVLKYNVDLLYNRNGKLISYYHPPNNRYILTDANGDLQIYNPDSNKVKISRLEMLTNEASVLHYFLTEQSETMGLDEFEMSLDTIYMEDSMRVSIWQKQGEMLDARTPSKVKMVHKRGELLFMGYFLPDGSTFKKGFYSKYENVEGYPLPGRLLEITYLSPQDSMVEDTRFIDYQVNQNASPALLNFTVPDDAEIY